MGKYLKFKKEIARKCEEIRLVVTDVDGVLTDGGMYYSEKGEYLKKFNTHDSMGIELLLTRKIKTVLVTREKSKIVKKRAEKIKPAALYLGVLKKEKLLAKISKKFNLSSRQIAYIGDDVNDYEIMKLVGLSATPNDGEEKTKTIADYVCKLKGGEGAFREFANMILSNKKSSS